MSFSPFPNDPGLQIAPSAVAGQAINVFSYGATGNGNTDDTAAVQTALNLASAGAPASGLADVWLPSGYEFKLSQLAPAPGVRLWCYGAAIIPNLSGINQALLHYPNANSLSRFEVRGGAWLGTGSEGSGAPQQALFDIVSGGGCNDVLFQDMYISNWGSGALYLRNPQRARILTNTLQTIGANKTINSINFVVDGTLANQGQDLFAVGNIVEASQCAAIAYVNINNSGPTDVRFIAQGNVCVGLTNGNDLSGAINIELDGTAAATFNDFLVEGNHIHNPLTAGAAYGVLLGQSDNDGGIGRAIVKGNTITCDGTGGYGVECFGNSDVIVEGNRISATTPIAATGTPFKTGNRYSTGASQGRAILVAGTVTVNTAEVIASDNIILSRVVTGGTVGELTIGTIVAGTSFVITSNNALDTSTIYWRIDH